MMKKGFFIFLMSILGVSSLEAAPIGVPGATLDADQSTVGVELDFLIDRNIDGGSKDLEGMNLLVRGDIGVTKRIDLFARLGFGRFEIGGSDTDTGPAYGIGTKITWAAIPNANLKIGSVVQMTQVRADRQGARAAYKAYDFALGVFMDKPAQKGGAMLSTYGGLVFSSADVEVVSPALALKENGSYGFFAGVLMNMNQRSSVGLELRLVDQTALSFFTAFAF